MRCCRAGKIHEGCIESASHQALQSVWAFVLPGRGLGEPGYRGMLTKKEEQLPRASEEIVGTATSCLRWSKGVVQND